MIPTRQTWAVVLAAGEGTRLSSLTTQQGASTPKQYCSLRGGRSLLGDALARAARIVPRERVVVVVAAEHRRFFEREVAELAPENVVVQPRNRGTAAGILLPALAIVERDPQARLVFLPSDHFVADEGVLAATLRTALDALDGTRGGPILLGITPDAPETGYGWIAPGAETRDLGARGLRPVARFVEKPEARVARELFASGALWNSFLFAVDALALLRLVAERLPLLLADFHAAFALDGARRADALDGLYARLVSADFSRDVLQDRAGLALARVPPCGWTDLGTPERVAACLAGLAPEEPAPQPRATAVTAAAALDLRQALARFAGRGAPAAAALSA